LVQVDGLVAKKDQTLDELGKEIDPFMEQKAKEAETLAERARSWMADLLATPAAKPAAEARPDGAGGARGGDGRGDGTGGESAPLREPLAAADRPTEPGGERGEDETEWSWRGLWSRVFDATRPRGASDS
jgi:hypothetical protein